MGWGTADTASLELVQRRKLLGWAPGTTTKPEKGSLCGRGLCEWREVRLGQAMAGRVGPPGSGGPRNESSFTGKSGKTRGSCPHPPTPLSHTHFFLQSRKNRQSSLERAGPMQDLLLTRIPKEYQPVPYRSISSSMCFQSSCHSSHNPLL